METAPRDPYPYAWLIWIVATIGLTMLVVDHWAHLLGVLPYLVLLACPLMHLFMHHGHRHDSHGDKKPDPE